MYPKLVTYKRFTRRQFDYVALNPQPLPPGPPDPKLRHLQAGIIVVGG